MTWFRNPWGKPRWLALITVMYVLWSVVPVVLAIAFAFNDGRSRTTWQGFSFRWFTGETGSVLHEPALRDALGHTLLEIIWHVLKKGTTYADLGPTYLEQLQPERLRRQLVKRLERLGHKVTLEPAA